MKCLVDECLAPALARLAVERGHVASSHVVWIGKTGTKDWDLMKIVLAGDWTLVTRNAFDFRGPAAAPGGRGLYARTDLHAGLICLNGPPKTFDEAVQLELFDIALDDVQANGDLINQVLEISLGEDDEISVRRYALPAA